MSILKCVIILLVAMFIHLHAVELNEESRRMIREAILDFSEKPSSNPTTCSPQMPVVSHQWRPECEKYNLLPYILFHPLTQFTFLTADAPFKCPICERDGTTSTLMTTDNWRDGHNSRNLPRMIYGMNSPVLLVSKIYKCNNGHNEIPANDPSIVRRIPDCYLPFMLMHKSGLTVELLQFIEDLVDSGLSIQAIESLIHKSYKRNLSLREERFWTDCRIAKSLNVVRPTTDLPQAFPEVTHFPSSDFLTNVIVSSFKRNEALYSRYFSSLSARWISCDHTFKTAMNIGYFRHCDNKWINQYRSLFCIMNELGQVIQWQLTSTESFDEVRHMFSDLKERFERQGIKLEGVFIDNCCKWRMVINYVLPEVPVKLDLFHAVQRIVKKIPKKKKLSKEIANDIGLIFRQRNDLGQMRRLNTAKPSEILENFSNFEKKWEHPTYKNGTKVLSKDVKKEIKKLKVHVKKGCLSDIPPSCGTSKNERLHKDLNKIIRCNRLGVELAYVRIFRKLYLHNKEKDLQATTACKSRVKQCCNRVINQNAKGFEEIESLDNVEIFGIRPKQNGQEATRYLKHEPKRIDEINRDVLMDIHDSLKKSIQGSEKHNIDGEEMSELIMCEILCQAIAWWATALTLENFLGKRVVDKRKVASLSKARLNTSTLGSKKVVSACKGEDQAGCEKEYSQRLHHLAAAWGFSIVEIPKNGDCLFTAVAFQLQQLFSVIEEDSVTKSYLQKLGIRSEQSLAEIASLLRNLVVDEWTGSFAGDYYDFFHGNSKNNYVQQAESFRISGTFASDLGDAMPLALANVLGMPLVILSLDHFTHFLDICPREVKCGVFPIYLCYYSTGGGHYDALLQHTTTPTECEQSIETESVLAVAEQQEKREKQNETRDDLAPPRSCRCGVNAKKKKNNARQYSVRCPCLKGSTRKCRASCKCVGSCGGSECRDIRQEKEETTPRKQRKRRAHPLQENSPKKARIFMNEKKEKVQEGNMNDGEFYVLHAIINYAQSSEQSTLNGVCKLYNDITKMIEESTLLNALPVRQRSNITINREVRKILQNDENFDSFVSGV